MPIVQGVIGFRAGGGGTTIAVGAIDVVVNEPAVVAVVDTPGIVAVVAPADIVVPVEQV